MPTIEHENSQPPSRKRRRRYDLGRPSLDITIATRVPQAGFQRLRREWRALAPAVSWAEFLRRRLLAK